jgi:formylglycine-generating enzyme required for sulfatase activity
LEGAPAPPAEGQNPVNSPPAIVSVPSTRSVARGGTTTLFVSASGENLTYQWKMNGQNIAGATSSALPLENATGADAGQYVVNVTNPNGTVSSQAITVTVKMPVVPAGVYRINNSAGNAGHEVSLTSFSIDQHEVTKAFWDEVYTWAIANGYDFSNAGIAEGPEYPVHSINWYDSIKWANALSERDGHTPCYYTDNNCTVIYRAGQVDLTNYNVKWNANGYRLPTETEWEVAARGGLVGSKYAWGESPSTTRANFDQTLHGATIPVGSFPANGYGLYEVGGNLREWTWDWNDTGTYEYDFREIFTKSTAGTLGLVNATDTNATWTWRQAHTNQEISSDILWALKKTIELDVPISVQEVRNLMYTEGGTLRFKINFTYTDGTNEDSVIKSTTSTSWIETLNTNPFPEKKVTKVQVYIYSNNGYWCRVKDTSIGKAFLANVNGSVEGVVFNLPQYEETDASHFWVKIEADREAGDDIWFELIDGNSTKTYAGTDFGKFLAMPSEVKRPKKLRVLLKARFSGPTAGGTALREVFWGMSNPKSHWTGTERIIRDNHYAEALENLGKRTFSTPDQRYSTVGFRLVQRP